MRCGQVLVDDAVRVLVDRGRQLGAGRDVDQDGPAGLGAEVDADGVAVTIRRRGPGWP